MQGTERLCASPVILAALDHVQVKGPIGHEEISSIGSAGIEGFNDLSLVWAGDFDSFAGFPFALGHVRTAAD